MGGRSFEITPAAADATGRAVVTVRVPEDLRYVEGHFPENPIVPGIAQLLPLVYRPAREAWPDLGSLRAIKRLKFLDALRPGQTLEVELLRDASRVRFTIRRGETDCTRGSLVFDP